MNAAFEIPVLPRTLVLSPPLTDEEFEKLRAANALVQLERTKEGTIIVNPPAGGCGLGPAEAVAFLIACYNVTFSTVPVIPNAAPAKPHV